MILLQFLRLNCDIQCVPLLVFSGFPNDLFDRWRNILGQNSIERVPLPEPEPRLNVRTGAFFDSIAALPTPHLVPCNPGDVDSPYEVAVTRPAEEGLPQEERRAVLGLSAPTSVAPPLPVQTAESSCSEDEDEDEDEDDDEPALLGYPPIKPIHPVARGRGRLPRSRHLFARPDRPWVRLVRPRHVIRDARGRLSYVLQEARPGWTTDSPRTATRALRSRRYEDDA
ncbi:coiled-coil domain-containing protein 96-like isoform X4 [Bacillus rossius redtenbacheri]|uniref:coiled-coil domain-containing protein 96-like isoform X4 n=1 Tax=Bacillus rossius redtenbacheri TaxID=93214 RepID=UPI002FDCEAC9